MQLGPAYDAAVRLANLEDQVRRMASNQLGQALSSNQSDGSVGLQIGQDASGGTTLKVYQGSTTPRDPQTGMHPTLAYFGEVFSGGVPQESAVLLFRPDGTTCMVAGNKGAQILDPAGNQVLASDEYGTSPSGKGLRSPWVGYGTPISNVGTNWPSTTATALTDVSVLSFPAQHAKITWSGSVYCPPGTTGQVQVQINNGAAGPVYTCGAGYTNMSEAIPLGTWGFQQGLTMTGLAAVTSGPGPVYFGISGVWGEGSP